MNRRTQLTEEVKKISDRLFRHEQIDHLGLARVQDENEWYAKHDELTLAWQFAKDNLARYDDTAQKAPELLKAVRKGLNFHTSAMLLEEAQAALDELAFLFKEGS